MKESLAHTVWECKYHIVWVPKRRRKVIYGHLKVEIGQMLRKLCEYKVLRSLKAKPVLIISICVCPFLPNTQ